MIWHDFSISHKIWVLSHFMHFKIDFSVNSNGQMAWNDLKLQLYTNQLVQNWVLDNFGRPKWPKFAFLATFRSKIGQIFVNLALFWSEFWSKLVKFRLLAKKRQFFGQKFGQNWSNFDFWPKLASKIGQDFNFWPSKSVDLVIFRLQ